MSFVSAAKPAVRSSQEELEDALPALRRYCLSLTGNSWDSEDLFQQTLLKALPRLNSKYEQSKLHVEAYLITVAKHCWIDELRKKFTARSFLSQSEPAHPEPFIYDWELEEALNILISSLSPLQRTVFLLRDVFGYAGTEVAVMMRTTEGAVRIALHRARKALSKLQEQNDFSPLTISDQGEMNKQESDQLLKSYLLAFRTGDMARIVELGLQDVIPPAIALTSLIANESMVSSVSSSRRSKVTQSRMTQSQSTFVLTDALNAGWQSNKNASVRGWKYDECNSLCRRTNEPWRAQLRHLFSAA